MPAIRAIRLHGASAAYDGRDAVLSDLDLHLVPGWTGIVGANGAGKTTLLHLVTGALAPSAGSVVRDPDDALVVVCPQRIDDAPDDRSAGERKRWQLDAALSADADVLVLDEPTNHLDAGARAELIARLRRFRGIGLVVSHDRALLDELTRSTVHVDRGGARQYAGGYSAARTQWLAEADARRDAWADANRARKRAERLLADARRTAASAERSTSRSARMKSPKDSDARGVCAAFRAETAAKSAGKVVTRRRREADDAIERARALALEKERGRAVFVDWEPPPRRWLASADGLALARDARVRVTGPNGAGKSTLLRALIASCTLPPERVLWLPQELTADDGVAIAADVARLPPSERGRVGQLAAALGLDPSRALGSELPSPGEARKLAIALGLARRVWLVVLDEPTNHLDLPSIERLEAALADYPGALVVASHDDAFAEALALAEHPVAVLDDVPLDRRRRHGER